MATITATEFKQNLGAYLDKTADEDIYITKNDKIIAKLTTPTKRPKYRISDFFGTLSDSALSLEEAKLLRIMEKIK